MKNKALLTLAIMSISGALFATDFVISTADSLAGFVNVEDDVNVYYTASDKKRARIGSSNLTILYAAKSFTLKAGGVTIPETSTVSTTPTWWNTLGTYTFDIATANPTTDEDPKTYNVFKNESSSYFNLQMGSITIKNSKGSAVTAIIDAGSKKFELSGGANAQQTPTLNIQTNTNFTTTLKDANAFYLGMASRLNVTNNSTFTIASQINTVGDQVLEKDGVDRSYLVPQIYVEEGSKLVTATPSGGISFNGQTNINIQGTWEIRNGAVTLGEKTTTYIKNLKHGNGHNLDIYGEVELGSATSLAQFVLNDGSSLIQSSGNVTYFNREATIKNGATFKTSGYLQINGGAKTDIDAKWADITIEEGAKFYVDGQSEHGTSVVLGSGELILKQENAMTTSTGDFLVLTGTLNSTGAIIRVEANQTFKSITANAKNIDIYLSTTAEAILTSDFSARDGARIVIHDFAEDRICVGNKIQNPNNVFEAYQTINGEEVKIQNLFINNGWLSAVAVPEPAEWAMILGSLALGFAIYRRKK